MACWPWLRRRDRDGYGQLDVGYAAVPASRAALEVKLGRLLRDDEKAIHGCDNPPCCNPDHLKPGTIADNNADCVAKGRQSYGETHGTAKLTAAQADEIRAACATQYHHGLYRELSRKYGITSRQVSYIASGKRRSRETNPAAGVAAGAARAA